MALWLSRDQSGSKGYVLWRSRPSQDRDGTWQGPSQYHGYWYGHEISGVTKPKLKPGECVRVNLVKE